MGDVLNYPTKRKRAYKQPPKWWEQPLPGNVQRLDPPSAPTAGPERTDPAYILIVAMLMALQTHDLPAFRFVRRALEKGPQVHPDDAGYTKALDLFDVVDR